MAVDVGSAVGYLDLDIAGFLNGLRTANEEASRQTQSMSSKVGSAMTTMGNKLTSAGKTLTAGVTTPLVAAGTVAFKFSSDFETAIAKVSTIADPAKKSIESIKEEIVNLSNQTGMAASDLAEATYQAISAGVDTSSSVEFVANASKLATAGFTDTTTAVDTLTTVINAYGLEAKDASHISDVLISTQNKGKTTVNELGASMGKIIPTANSMNVSIEELGTAYSYLTAGGIDTAESTTYLNGMFNELGKGGTKVSDILKDRTGKSFQELMDGGMSLREVLDILNQEAEDTGVGFNDLWSSQEAGKAALALINTSTDEYNTTLKDFQSTVGDTDEAYAKMSETTEFKLNVAMQNGVNALRQLGDTIKEMLLPFIEKGVAMLQKLNDWLASLSQEEKEQIVKIAAVVAALGPALMIVGKVASTIEGLITTFGKLKSVIPAVKGALVAVKGAIAGISAPVVAVVAVIGTLVAAFATLWKTNEEFRNKITAIWNQIKGTFDKLCQGIVDRLNKLGFDFENIGEVLKAIWKGFCDFLAPIFEGVFQNIANTFDTIVNVILGILDFFIAIFTGDWEGAWDAIKGIFESIWNGIVAWFQNIGNTLLGILDVICGWFGTTWDNTWNSIKQFFVDIWNSIVSFFTNIIDTIKTSVSNFVTTIINFFAQLPTNIANFITNAWNSVVIWATNMVNKAREMGQNFLNAVVEFFTDLPYKIGHFIGSALTNVALWVVNMVNKAREMGQNFINNVVAFFTQLPGKILQFITSAWNNVTQWATNMVNKAREMGTNFINNVVSFFTQLPGKIQQFISSALNNVTTWVSNMASKARDAGSQFINNVVSFIQQLPGKIKQFLDSAINNLRTWVTQMGQKGKEAVQSLINNVISAASGIASKVMSIGSDIVSGVWNGIKNAASWFTNQVKGFFSGIVDGVKDALGIGSPSKVFRDEIGKWLPPGVAQGFKAALPAAMNSMEKDLNKGIDSIESDDVSVTATATAIGFKDTIKSIYDDLVGYFESVEARIGRSVNNMAASLAMLIQQGQMMVNSDGTLGYVGYGGFTNNPNSDKYTERDDSGKPKPGDGDTFIFNSPKAIDEIEAARQMKKTKQDMAEGF